MKRMSNIEKDFEFVEIYDINVKDLFGNKFYIALNTVTGHIRFISKNKEYNAKLKKMNAMKLNHIIVRKYEDVIDITRNTYDMISKLFSGAILPVKENLNLY